MGFLLAGVVPFTKKSSESNSLLYAIFILCTYSIAHNKNLCVQQISVTTFCVTVWIDSVPSPVLAAVSKCLHPSLSALPSPINSSPPSCTLYVGMAPTGP